jgi:hypothetical protein
VSAYKTAAAFREALKARLRALAKDGPWEPQQLQRQLAYDRLLERLYLADDGWIVKGAVALLARDIGVRASLDVDVYRASTTDVAESDLRTAAKRDVGDWFRFDVGPRGPVADGAAGLRLPVIAYVGDTQWARFHVDLVGSDLRMTGEPEDVPALALVDMADIKQGGYRAYPLVDHVADKVAATIERHGAGGMPSTRFRDLVDLVAIARGASVDATAQMAALTSEARRRGLVLPDRFDVPDRQMWVEGYRAEAGRSLLPAARELDGALAVVRPFLDPLLDGSAAGRWDRAQGAWDG